jgi:hypothetical protein
MEYHPPFRGGKSKAGMVEQGVVRGGVVVCPAASAKTRSRQSEGIRAPW